jgi:hypothetical protein
MMHMLPPFSLFFRDHQDSYNGMLYLRCFIYNDKIKAICTNELKANLCLKVVDYSDQSWRPRSQHRASRFDQLRISQKDIIVEYASLGAFCHTSSGDFKDNRCVTVSRVVRISLSRGHKCNTESNEATKQRSNTHYTLIQTEDGEFELEKRFFIVNLVVLSVSLYDNESIVVIIIVLVLVRI